MTFDQLRLAEPLLKAVENSGYTTPTPIQIKAIPHVLAGRDVLGCAQTGTGKTAAFALPILHRLMSERAGEGADYRPIGARALVLSPTRELAVQIHDSFREYGRGAGLRSTVVYGGVHQHEQMRSLLAGVDIIVATPGRLLDLMGQRMARVTLVETVVLDEADRMLDMGFLPDIRRILAHIPEDRQTLMFSATMPPPIRSLAREILRDPAYVEVDRTSSAALNIEHFVHYVDAADKPRLLARLLKTTPHTRALVFTRTKTAADRVARSLARAGVRAAALHGDKAQEDRTRALANFRTALTPVLVATDIAARGLDVDDISHVFNYDLTGEPETYVHRIGRTARAGASGTAISFCTPADRRELKAIERLIGAPLKPANGEPPAAERRDEAPAGDNGRPRRRSRGGARRRRSGAARPAAAH